MKHLYLYQTVFNRLGNRALIKRGPLLLSALICWVAVINSPLVSITQENRQQRSDPNLISAINPHWLMDGCPACHKMDRETALPLAPEEVDVVCLSCHNGKNASAEVHPIHRTPPKSDFITIPSNWPLINGKLGCLTCHDVNKACDQSLHRPLINPMFLRDQWMGRS